MCQELARYEADGTEVVITDDDIRNVLCKNANVTDVEMRMFIELCRAQRLNPFIKEAYLIKYGNNPATIVTGKDVFTKRAFRNPRFRGMEAGVTVWSKMDGGIVQRPGSMVSAKNDTLLGGWCRVYVDGYEVPVFDEVSFSEYSTGKSNWVSKPGTMIRKVAMVHALREAFPEEFQGLYDECEMGEAVVAPAEPKATAQPEPVYEVEEYEAAGDYMAVKEGEVF